MPKERVLELLKNKPGEYVSGEYISDILGVSRAAVWKDIKALREESYHIESLTRKGYRLCHCPDTLSLPAILSSLQDAKREEYKDKIIILDCIDSTNNYAKKLAMEGAADKTVIIAREQTKGRGRMGRSFESLKDKGLYMSLILYPDIFPDKPMSLTAYAAVIISKAIEKACGIVADIKWINDLLINDKKIAGILTEISIEGETGKIEYLILGIGINVSWKKSEIIPQIRNTASSIKEETGKVVSLNELAANIINETDNLRDAWIFGNDDYRDYFISHCSTIGKEVISKPENLTVTAKGIDDDFALIVEYADGRTEKKRSGEIVMGTKS